MTMTATIMCIFHGATLGKVEIIAATPAAD